ncbi:MAG: rRNA pseudouridine synthase [Francisellaceae bacterium]|nr:rRNA pseudouridine synthase [Francisellaceae bacterium]
MSNIYQDSIIPVEYQGERLDFALSKIFPDFSRSRLKMWIDEGAITVNNQILKPKDKVMGGERVIIQAIMQEITMAESKQIDLNIVYEDKDILILNKPARLTVHPGAGNQKNTLLNGLLHYLPDLNLLPRAGIVHRLDKDTTGLMVIAKNLKAHTSLVAQLQDKTVNRTYHAIVNGVMTAGGKVDMPIKRDSKHRTRMATHPMGKEAVTQYRVIKRYKAFTYVELRLETGRTHQIRVHMSHIHYPIVGDKTYGGRFKLPKEASPELITQLREFPRQALHAKKLGLIHPETLEYKEWEIDLPQDMQILLETLH